MDVNQGQLVEVREPTHHVDGVCPDVALREAATAPVSLVCKLGTARLELKDTGVAARPACASAGSDGGERRA